MSVITEIKSQVKTPTRCNIYLDNVYYCAMELETVMSNRLKVGMHVEKEELNGMQMKSERLRATDKAMSFLSKTKKTEKQVREYLMQKGYVSETVDEVVKKLKEYKFLNDEEYAEDYARAYSNKKGVRLLKMELAKKGISGADIESAFEDYPGETEGALAVGEKYMKNKEKTKENFLKCYKHLLSKGFSYDTAKEIIYKLGNNEDEDF